MAYYYLMAQLPYLIYEQRAPMTSAAFKALCETMLNKKDMKILSSLELDPDPMQEGEQSKEPAYAESAAKTGCKFVDKWHEWERTLRLSLAKQRAAKKQNYSLATVEPPFFPAEANQAAAKAIANDISPLEGEILIDKARWNAIENLVSTNYFDRSNVFAYYLKLLIMERRASFNVDKGFTEYKSLYASIIDNAHHSLGEPV